MFVIVISLAMGITLIAIGFKAIIEVYQNGQKKKREAMLFELVHHASLEEVWKFVWLLGWIKNEGKPQSQDLDDINNPGLNIPVASFGDVRLIGQVFGCVAIYLYHNTNCLTNDVRWDFFISFLITEIVAKYSNSEADDFAKGFAGKLSNTLPHYGKRMTELKDEYLHQKMDRTRAQQESKRRVKTLQMGLRAAGIKPPKS